MTRVFPAGAPGVIGIRLVPPPGGAGHAVVGTSRPHDTAAQIHAFGEQPVLRDALDTASLLDAVSAFAPDLVTRRLSELPDRADQISESSVRNTRIRTEGTLERGRARPIAGLHAGDTDGSRTSVATLPRGTAANWDTRAMPGTPYDGHDLAARVRTALTARDLDAFGAFLSDDVRWGDDDHPRRCRSRSDVLATFRRLMGEGAEADITELVAGTNGLLCGLSVRWSGTEDHPRERTLFHFYLVRDDHIVEIRPFDDRDSAARAAGVV